MYVYFTLQMVNILSHGYLDKHPSRVEEGEHQEEGQEKTYKGEKQVLTIGRLGKLLCMYVQEKK